MKPKQRKVFRVWIQQVNQTYLDVPAEDADAASEKAQRQWRREYAEARVSDVRELLNYYPTSGKTVLPH